MFCNFDDDFLKNHALENCSFFIMQIGTIRNPDNADKPTTIAKISYYVRRTLVWIIPCLCLLSSDTISSISH